MQTVLGLVIHRFDIHIKRETGCFDVRGEQVPGDCWSSTLFFTDTAQHSLGGWGGVGVGGGWGGVVGADCWGRGVQKNSKWGAVIPLCWLDVTPTPPPSLPTNHLLMPDPWGLTIRLHLSLSPCIHTNDQFTPFLTECLLPLSPLLLSTHFQSSSSNKKAQVTTFCPQKHLKDEWQRDASERAQELEMKLFPK